MIYLCEFFKNVGFVIAGSLLGSKWSLLCIVDCGWSLWVKSLIYPSSKSHRSSNQISSQLSPICSAGRSDIGSEDPAPGSSSHMFRQAQPPTGSSGDIFWQPRPPTRTSGTMPDLPVRSSISESGQFKALPPRLFSQTGQRLLCPPSPLGGDSQFQPREVTSSIWIQVYVLRNIPFIFRFLCSYVGKIKGKSIQKTRRSISQCRRN